MEKEKNDTKGYYIYTYLTFKSGAKVSFADEFATETERDDTYLDYNKRIIEALGCGGLVVVDGNTAFRSEDVSYFISEKKEELC